MITDENTEKILDALDRFVRQRPGFDPGNYDCSGSYRSERRSVTRDLHDYRELRWFATVLDVPHSALIDGFRAYSGRLSWDGEKLDYCTGQYFPTEYRKAACAVLAAALWDHRRDEYAAAARPGESAGDAIRRQFRQEFGTGLARRWFN